MAFTMGERNQATFFPPSIDDYVGPHDPVRAYDTFVDRLDFGDLGISLDPDQAGPPAFDPRAMLKLLIYGYAYGIRSSRKFEQATYHNLSVIWLMGGLKPDHKTIARFRQEHKEALGKVLKQCVRLCLKLGLIEGNTLFVDGTKMRGNASLSRTWTQDKCREVLKKTDERINALLAESEALDQSEQAQGSLVRMQEDLQNREALQAKVQQILKELEESGAASLNTTDRDCRKVKGRQGTHAGYNMQAAVDDKHGLVVHTDVVADNNDRHQFASQVNQANAVLGRPCQTACADAGYAHTADLKAIDEQNIRVIVPSQEQVQPEQAYHKDRFSYDHERDVYVCPQGQILTRRSTDEKGRTIKYLVSSPAACQRCPAFGLCTKAKGGRAIIRLMDEEVKKRLEAQYRAPESKAVFRRRKEKAEHPFGHLKWNLGIKSFLLRGLAGVRAEAGLMFTGFNMTRMMTLLSVPGLIQKLQQAA